MGCGASNAVAGGYAISVNDTWNQVERTIEVRKRPNSKLVVKRSGWKTVRIFVSSTFRDFHAERETLIKEVFPDLRQWCESRRLHLVDCDLRWGVPVDSTTEETLRVCLGEIDRCYQDNIMPFFLNLTSVNLSTTMLESMSTLTWLFPVAAFLTSVPQKHKNDLVDVNPIAPEKLKVLKQMLKERFLSNQIKFYSCEYDGVDGDGKIELKGLEEFSKMVFDFFKSRIEEQYPLEDVTTDPYRQVMESHESFMRNRSSLVLGRNDILEEIKQHIIGVGVDKPLLLLGGPGTGKSSIMARVAEVTVAKAMSMEIPGSPDQGWHVFYHFVGAIPGSPDLEACLKRLLKEMNVINESKMPKDLETTCQVTCSALSSPNTKPVIIIIDALNQFDECKESTVLNWLPVKLSPQVRCVFSMIDETTQHKTLKSRKHKPVELFVTPLDMSSRKAIVVESLGKYNKKLDEEQMSSLLSKESSQNPLWLSIACEELRVYGLFEKLSKKITSLPDGLLSLLESVLSRFEEENGGQVVVATLCLLECSKTGLLERELLMILGNQKNLTPSKNLKNLKSDDQRNSVQLSASQWARVYRVLKPFLRPFGDSGEGRLDFYHRSLSKAVRAKYFKTDSWKSIWWHTVLANYFETIENMDRQSEEYPYHLTICEDKGRLKEYLKQWRVFHHFYHPEFSGELLAYWRSVGDKAELYDCYKENLENMTNNPNVDKEEISLHYEQVARVVMQSGDVDRCFNLLQTSLSMEENDLGAKPMRMMELYNVAATMHNERLTLHDFITKKMMPDLKECISSRRKALRISEQLTERGEKYKYERAFSLMKLAFNLKTWYVLGGDNNLQAQEGYDLGVESLKEAKEIYEELGDKGHISECIMNEGLLLAEVNQQEALELYKAAEVLCIQIYGDVSVLSSRLFTNIAILLEEMGNTSEAFKYFKRGLESKIQVFGDDHPQTGRLKRVLQEPAYQRLTSLEQEQRNQQR
ncbi:telomerase protein component 1-like [Anneissia japonica]|uniref:telomerase protein component 1-like n=1 Tax=Anneissia japonica TaxID=1529436 RepID=UPI00142593A2|nr:telomerase protein component 1-like [Anneissia japonica]